MDLLTSTLQRIYRAAQDRYPDILFQGDGSRREIALTFDDGPHPRDTTGLLEVLDKYQVRATFHLVGQSAKRYPDLVRLIHQGRHQLALHCYRHVAFPLENPTELRAELEQTQNIIAEGTGIAPESIRDVRPPYGLVNSQTRSRLTEWGYRLVMWNCLPPHWMQPVRWSIHQVRESILPGAVIVLHDGHGHGRRVAEIVSTIVPYARSQGFEFITVEEMQIQRLQSRSQFEKKQR